MEQLLSGLIGALIASILSVTYFYFFEKSKLRSEVLLEFVGFCDEIYRHMENLRIYKQAEFTDKKIDLSIEDYRIISRELTVLLTSTKVHAKMAIVFGEKEELNLFLELSNQFRHVSSILRKATRSGWIQEGPEINNLLTNEIEPLRRKIMRDLIRGTKVMGIPFF